MKYYDIPVTVCVQAISLEEAQIKAATFMPWTTDGRTWSISQHEGQILPNIVDNWTLVGVDSDELEATLTERGMR
jgi:hypothetical protein